MSAVGDLLEDVRRLIEEALPGSSAEVTDQGGGDHLHAVVRAPQFAGRPMVDQHRMVKAAVRQRFADGSIHALSLKTIPEEDA